MMLGAIPLLREAAQNIALLQDMYIHIYITCKYVSLLLISQGCCQN
jgi:hypothetical protein